MTRKDFEKKDNRGQIWGNDKKQQDNHPDFKGDCLIDGVEYWVAAWKRKPDANPKSPSLSFSFQRKDEAHNKGVNQARQAASVPAQKPQQPSAFDNFDDDLPF